MRARLVAASLALLVTVGFGPTASGVDGDASVSASWLCQLSFERGLEADPADPARFDAAVGACASGDEFAAVAASVPGALGDRDPIAFLIERCGDDDAGLDRYQSCGSVAELVEAAAPEPTPAAETPGPDKLLIDDEAGGLQFEADDPLYVPVPPGIKAHVPGAWKVKYFPVKGKNLKQLDRSIRKASRKACGDHAWGCVTNRKVAVPKGRTLSNGERCWVSRIGWKDYKPIVWMPRWKTDHLVHQDVLRWWTAELARTTAHEAEHIRIDNEHREWIQDRVVVGTPCGAIGRKFAKLERKLTRAHQDFHRRENLRERIPWPDIPEGERQSVKG